MFMKRAITILLSSLVAFSALGNTTAFAVGEKVCPIDSNRYSDYTILEDYSFLTTGENPEPITIDNSILHQGIFFSNGFTDLDNKDLEAQIIDEYIANSKNKSINAEQLSIRYYGTLSDGTMLLDVFGPFYYLESIECSVIGNYVYCQLSSNQYEVYKGGSFSNLYAEYENGHITGALLDETAEILNFAKFADNELIINGDVDSNEVIDIKDATAIQKHLASIDVLDVPSTVLDANGDGKMNIMDSTAIQRYIVK